MMSQPRQATAPTAELTTDEAGLVAAAQEGNEQAIRALVRMMNRRLFRVARGIVNSDAEAEDVVQETYLKGFINLHHFRGRSSFTTWMTRIAINAALMHQRKHITDEEYDTVSEANNKVVNVIAFPGMAPESTEENFQRVQVRALLESCMSALPANLRLPLMMFEVEQMTVAEIAQELGVSGLVIKTRLFRARRRLRKDLEAQRLGSMSDLFPFDGLRCAHMADRVIVGLQHMSFLSRV